MQKLKGSTKQLDAAFKKWDKNINGVKSTINQAAVLDRSEIEHVKRFVFHGSVVPNFDDDVRRRILLASATFGRWRS